MSVKNLDLVSIRCTYTVPPEIVFDAWVKTELISKWLFVGPTSEISHIELDLKKHGKFSIVEYEKGSGEYIDHYGEYLEIDRPKKLAFTLAVPKHFTEETTVVIEINAIEKGCELILTQTGVSKDTTEESWKRMLAQLSLTLENQ